MRYKYTTSRQEGGDDGYCYVVRKKRTGLTVSGLTRREATYYREKWEKEEIEFHESNKKKLDH